MTFRAGVSREEAPLLFCLADFYDDEVPKGPEALRAPFWHFCHPAGIALYEKFGYEIDGTHRRFAFRDGEYADAYSMARIKPSAPA